MSLPTRYPKVTQLAPSVLFRRQEGINVGVHITNDCTDSVQTGNDPFIFVKHLHFDVGSQPTRDAKQLRRFAGRSINGAVSTGMSRAVRL